MKKTHFKSLALLTMTLYASISVAITDSRIQRINFEEGKVHALQGSAMTATQIVFGEDEIVLGHEGGDMAAWQVDKNASMPNMVFLKPTILGSNSNITIVTNKHSYYFHVRSDKTLQPNPSLHTYAIRFSYPQEAALKAKALKEASFDAQTQSFNPNINPEQFHWDYRFSGSNELAPKHVFDNGQFTYFEFAKNQAIPAIFAIDDKSGKEAVVNARRMGDYLVIQRLAPQFTLRSGGITTSIFNSAEIARIKAGARPL